MSTPSPEAAASAPAAPSAAARIWKQLRARRVPQVAGLYLGAAWTFLQFVQWAAGRYLLSPHLVDLTLALLLLAVPSVLLLAYERGAPGRADRWTRRQKVTLPCNLVGALLVVALLFGGKDLGFMFNTVTVTDEDGEAVERKVAKQTFRREVALFFFENETGDPTLDWTRQGLPMALQVDLSQDLFLSAWDATSIAEQVQAAGFDDGWNVPLALQRELAEDANTGHLLSGSLARRDSAYVLTTYLRKSNSGQLVAERSFTGTDVLTLADEASLQVRRDLELPAQHLKESPDLPVAELLSPSGPAVRAWALARYTETFEHDYATADSLSRQAVTQDPTFALAHIQRYALLIDQRQKSAALEALGQARRHKYRLTERFQFWTKVAHLIFAHKPDQALAAAQQWNALYPDDTQALLFLYRMHKSRSETDEALAALRRTIDLDPAQEARIYQVGDLLFGEQRYGEALEAYETYVERFPEEGFGHVRIGKVYEAQGQFEQARAAYERAQVAEPDDYYVPLALGSVMLHTGRFENARAQLRSSLEKARTPQERATAYDHLIDHYWWRGETARALSLYDSLWTEQAAFLPASGVQHARLAASYRFAKAGRTTRAQAFVDSARAHPSARGGDESYLLDLDNHATELAVALRDTATAERLLRGMLERAEKYEADYGLEAISRSDYLRGRIALLAGRYDEAVEAFASHKEEEPQSADAHYWLARAHHRAGDTRAAEEHFQQTLRLEPSNPEVHLAYTRLLLDQNRRGDARAHLDRALRAWSEADSDYAPAREAQKLHNSLGEA